jgi:hypothetical protein
MHPYISGALAEMRIQELHRAADMRRLARSTNSRRPRLATRSTPMPTGRSDRSRRGERLCVDN